MEQAALTRIGTIADSIHRSQPPRSADLAKAIGAALDASLAVLTTPSNREIAVPAVLLAQARVAARDGFPLQTLLRRYFAGHSLFCDFLVGEATAIGRGGQELKRLLRAQATLCDRLLDAASEEYNREEAKLRQTPDRRRLQRIERLLEGELLDVSDLGYATEGFHLGAIGSGPGVENAFRELATTVECRLLTACRDNETHWAWLGNRRPLDIEDLWRHLSGRWPAQAHLAIGELGEGLHGWRLSHHQAKAALPIALSSHGSPVRYADVALLASILCDDLLATSLREIYLKPLEEARDGGAILRETLRAYFAAERNVSSSAAALGVNRNTVASRLRAIEATIGRSLGSCGPELETALRLAELGERDASSADQAPR